MARVVVDHGVPGEQVVDGLEQVGQLTCCAQHLRAGSAQRSDPRRCHEDIPAGQQGHEGTRGAGSTCWQRDESGGVAAHGHEDDDVRPPGRGTAQGSGHAEEPPEVRVASGREQVGRDVARQLEILEDLASGGVQHSQPGRCERVGILDLRPRSTSRARDRHVEQPPAPRDETDGSCGSEVGDDPVTSSFVTAGDEVEGGHAGSLDRWAVQPSQRFLSSLSAVSVMTLAALRLIMPSMGMLMSTARS